MRCPECQQILADDKCIKCMIKIKITRIQKTEYDWFKWLAKEFAIGTKEHQDMESKIIKNVECVKPLSSGKVGIVLVVIRNYQIFQKILKIDKDLENDWESEK